MTWRIETIQESKKNTKLSHDSLMYSSPRHSECNVHDGKCHDGINDCLPFFLTYQHLNAGRAAKPSPVNADDIPAEHEYGQQQIENLHPQRGAVRKIGVRFPNLGNWRGEGIREGEPEGAPEKTIWQPLVAMNRPRDVDEKRFLPAMWHHWHHQKLNWMIGCMGKTLKGWFWFVLFLFMKVRHFASQRLRPPESQPFAQVKAPKHQLLPFPCWAECEYITLHQN